jgi:hypothetical protein
MKYGIVRLMTLITCLFLSDSVFAEVKGGDQSDEILIVGSARIIEENMARARNEALRDAIFKGIESYLINRLDQQGMINHFTLLTQEIIPRAMEFIQNYHILTEEPIGNTNKILLSLRINKALLEEKLSELGISVTEGRQIKILFLVAEFFEESGEKHYWWKDPEEGVELSPFELTLYRVFQEAGFYPVNRLVGPAETVHDSEMTSPYLSLEKAVQWGRLFSADVVIQGRFELMPEENVTVSVRAINVDQAEFIAQSNFRYSPDENVDKFPSMLHSMEQAVTGVVKKFGPALIRSMAETRTQFAGLRLDLRGLSDLRQQQIFLDFVKTKVKGIKSILPIGMKYRSVSFWINYQGDIESLAHSLTTDSDFPFTANIKIRNDQVLNIDIL